MPVPTLRRLTINLSMATLMLVIASGSISNSFACDRASALAHAKKFDFDRAIDCYSSILEKGNPNPRDHFNLALSYQRKGNVDGAILHYRKALLLDPLHEKAMLNLGTLFVQQRDPDQAIPHLEEYLGKKPESVKALYMLGNAYSIRAKAQEPTSSHRRDDWLTAREYFQRATSLKPRFALAHFNLGVALDRLGLKDDAELSFKTALTLNPALLQRRDVMRSFAVTPGAPGTHARNTSPATEEKSAS